MYNEEIIRLSVMIEQTESVTTTNVNNDDDEIKYIQVIPNETEFLKWQSKRTCKNCKWLSRRDKYEYRYCVNKSNNNPLTGCNTIIPSQDFGCNQWEKKG